MKMNKKTFEYFDFRYPDEELSYEERFENREYRAIRFNDEYYMVYCLKDNTPKLNLVSLREVERVLDNRYWVPIDREQEEEFRKRWRKD